MQHRSGNPTWRDYPDLTTLVTASTLENLENTADAAVATGGTAHTSGAVFWGVFATGSEPTPPDDGQLHWGFRV